MNGITLAVEASACGILVWLAWVVTFRLYLHPLARFPGPILARLTDFHAVYYSLLGESHLRIWRAHQRYGPVVRTGPNQVVFASPQALHDIYESKRVQKSIGYTALVTTPGSENTFNTVDKTKARRKRRILAQGFSEFAIRSFEPGILRELDIFIRQIHASSKSENGWTEPVDMSQRSKWLMMDIVGDIGFGKSFDLQTKATNRFLIKSVVAASKLGGIVAQAPLLKHLRPPKWLAWKRTNKQNHTLGRTFGGLTERLIMDRNKEIGRTYPDLYSFVMGKAGADKEGEFSLKELLGESRLLILAGSDTTAAVLAATLFYLSRYPQPHEKLISLIRSTFSSSSDIRGGSTLHQLAYLRACIDETMRMTPPVGGALGREVVGNGIFIDGTFVDAGCDVGVGQYTLHHDEAVFPDSFTWRPERWMEGHVSPEQLALQRRSFHPFSLGSRKCLAPTLAYIELSVAIARTLWHFDFRRPAGKLGDVGGGNLRAVDGRRRENEYQLYEHFTSVHEGPYLEFRCRQGLSKELEETQL